MNIHSSLRYFLLKFSLFLFPFYVIAGPGDDLVNIQFFTHNLSRDGGHLDVTLDLVVNNDHHDYLRGIDVDISIDGGSYEPFAFVGNQSLYAPLNVVDNSRLHVSGYHKHDGLNSGLHGETYYIYFANTDNEIENNQVGFSTSLVGSNPQRSELFIGIDFFDIPRFQNATTVQLRLRGSYQRRWYQFPASVGGDIQSVNNTFSGQIDVSSDVDANKGNDELEYSVSETDIEKDNGKAYVEFNFEFLDNPENYDHLSELELKYEDQDGNEELYAYMRHTSLNTSTNPSGFERITIDSNVNSNIKDSYYLFIKQDVKDDGTVYTVEANNNRNRIVLEIPVKQISSMSQINNVKFIGEGSFYERHRIENKSVNINKEESVVYAISEEDDISTDEIAFEVFFNSGTGNAEVVIALENTDDVVYDHLACIEIGKRIFDPNGNVIFDGLIGHANHKSTSLGCSPKISNPFFSTEVTGFNGDTYDVALKDESTILTPYGGVYYTNSNGKNYLVIRDFIKPENYSNSIDYYVHGSYYQRDLGGQNKQIDVNWNSNLSTAFTVKNDIDIPQINIGNVEVSSTSNCQIDVNWTVLSSSYGDDPSRNKVAIYRNNELIDLVDANGGTSSYSDTTIEAGITYDYALAFVYIRDFDNQNFESLTGIKTSSKSAKINLLDAPSGLTSTQSGCLGDVEVSWIFSSNPSKFIVERRRLGESFIIVEDNLNGSLRSYIDTDITQNEVYEYRITAVADAMQCNALGKPSAVYTHSQDTQDITSIFDRSTYLSEASKGYFNNKTILEFNPNLDTEQYINQYKIYAREFGSTVRPQLLITLDINARKYEHTDGKAGVVYEYFVVGERVINSICGRQITASFSIESLTGKATNEVDISLGVAYDVGLRVATGVINGNITYTGGIAVPNVKVVAEREAANRGKSLYFNGSTSKVEIPYSSGISPNEEITFSLWLKPEVLEKFTVISERQVSYGFHLATTGQAIFYIKDQNSDYHDVKTAVGDIAVGNWANLTGTYNQNTYELSIYVNGKKSATNTLASGTKIFDASHQFPLTIGNQYNSQNYYFQGYIDELRIYDKALSDDEVLRNFGRFIANDTENLKGYWKVFEGLGDKIYDLANTNGSYFKNDGTLTNVIFTGDIPTPTQLGNAGFTDEFGNYVVEAVEYSGVGEQFNIIPKFTLGGAVHEFDPVRKTLFIGEASRVNNDKDFNDVSSFQFSGYVRFDFTDADEGSLKTSGSKGIQIYLDGGGAIAGDDRQAYKTDANGFFDVEIPIGQHYLEFRRNGHTFANGRFPAEGTFDFQAPITGVEILDITTHVLRGRVVGGTVEAAKKINFPSDPSVNNIGVAQFTVTSEDGKIVRQITTDINTGEYNIQLPPKKYNVSSVKWIADLVDIVSSGDIKPIDLGTIQAYNGTTEKDSVFDVNNVFVRIDSTFYNTRKDFVYRVTPELVVTDTTGVSIKEGAEQIYNLDQRDKAIAIDLSNLQYPTYISASNYAYKMKAVEQYTNKDSNAQFTVPVTDGQVTINNSIGVGYYLEDGKKKAYGVPEVINLDENGELIYLFKAQEPNINENSSVGQEHLSYTKQMSITLDVGSQTTYWPNPVNANETLRAYVFGGKQEGANFVTKAPPVVDFVLRDPPGSNSYATISKESSFFTTQEWSAGGYVDLSTSVGIGVGMNTLLGGGIVGVGEIAEGKILGVVSSNLNFDIEAGGEVTVETSFNEDITTNADAMQVGRSDVFVAKSQNMQTGIGVHIRPVPINLCGGNCYGDVMTDTNGNQYKMTRVIQNYMNPVGTPTYFIFSQNHIENVLIPDLIEIRNSFLTRSSSAYSSKIGTSHANFGTNNDDPVWAGNGQTTTNYVRTESGDFNGPSYIYTPTTDPSTAIDSIRVMNQQIRLWKEALANNEIQKWKAKKYGTKENVSIASGVTLERSNTTAVSGSAYLSFELSSSVGIGAKLEFDGYGVAVESEISLEVGRRASFTSTTGGGESTTTSYLLNDPDEDDAISVDIYPGEGSNGPIFLTIGGQTSCPFEDKITMNYATLDYINYLIEVETGLKNRANEEAKSFAIAGVTDDANAKYGERDQLNIDIEQLNALKSELQAGEVILSNATLQRDKPKLQINGTKTAQAFNVPADEAANFDLTLINAGEAGDPQFFAIQAIDETNPNGLEMTIDGQSINSSREFLVGGRASINKILRVRRGPNEYDYNDIGVVIKSTCQADPTGNDAVLSDTIYFSAKYLPVCTPLEIKAPTNNWTLNNSFRQVDGSKRFPITVSSYDVNTVGFESIKIQYKPKSNVDWVLLTTYYRDEDIRTEKGGAVTDPLLPTTGNSFTYDWIVGETFADGEYDIRALSGCALAETETEILTGIIDTKNPVPFGAPLPIDGILSAGEEPSIQFNEMINANLLSAANFDIRGVLNKGEIRHDASVRFNGNNNSYVKVESVNMANKAFSIEFYAKKLADNQNQVMIAQGNDPLTQMLLGINTSNNFYFKLANKEVVSSSIIDNNWHHFAVTYDPLNTDVVLYVDGTLDGVDNSFNVMNTLREDIYFGKTQIDRSFTGQMHEVRFWSKSLSAGDISINATQRMIGNESGLLYNWVMEDVHGDLALEKVRAKHAIVNANWIVEPQGYGLMLGGTANEALLDTPITFNSTSDYTVSFWFKSNGSTDEVLVSNGKGDGTDTNISGWTIGIDNLGKIYATSAGHLLTSTTTVTDSKWHHVALVCTALGNTVLFVDATEHTKVESSLLNGFGGSRFALGQRVYESGSNLLQDKFFTGNIDEVRVWNLSRKLDQISRDRYYQLTGDEAGLVAYYPFESYTETGGLLSVVSSDINHATSSSKITTQVNMTNSTLVQVTPTVKLHRPVEKINFSYVVNNDKVIITPNALSGAIENALLDFTVTGIKDVNGNTIESPITWSAYVDKNQVIWQDDRFNLETENGVELTFESKIFNNSGESKTFDITNIPSWLEVTPTSGTVGPLTTIPVSFKVSEDVNNGLYAQDILLSTDFNFAEPMRVSVLVKQAPPANWTINPSDFEFSMNVVGQISFDGVMSRDSGNILAAFVNGECRGLVNLTYLDSYDNYQAFLPIYSNSGTGEVLEFKVWEASTGIIHTGIIHNMSTSTFIADTFEGSPTNPKEFEIADSISRNIAIVAGWNWVSFNLQGTDIQNTNMLLSNLNPQDGDVISTRINKLNGGNYIQESQFDSYTGIHSLWDGTISANGGVKTSTLYKIKAANEGSIYYEGTIVNPIEDQIKLLVGWNYIGYTGTQKIEVNEALSNYVATTGDIIKSQLESAIYVNGFGWLGSLTILEPGKGYMIKTTTEQVFTYPSFNSSSGTRARVAQKESIDSSWSVASHKYADNMTAIVTIHGNQIYKGLLGAFIADECRGVAEGVYNPIIDETMYVLTIVGETEQEAITFKFKNQLDNRIFGIIEAVDYTNNKVLGSVNEPMELTIDSNDVLVLENTPEFISATPNPFSVVLTIKVNLEIDNSLSIQLFNSTGKEVYGIPTDKLSKGLHTFVIPRNNLETGVYFLKVVYGKEQVIKRIMITD